MDLILERIKNEPAVASTLVGAVVVLLVQAGVPISDGLANALTGLTVAVVALFVRSQVTPTRKTDPYTTAK